MESKAIAEAQHLPWEIRLKEVHYEDLPGTTVDEMKEIFALFEYVRGEARSVC